MFNRMLNRTIARFSITNPISRFINSTDYRIGIASEQLSENSTAINATWLTAPYILELICKVNSATEAEKREFLRDPASQNKLFEIIGSLFLHFSFCVDPNLSLFHLNALLGLLCLEPDVERQFYHSTHFTQHASPLSINSRTQLDNLVMAALHKYPTINLTSLSQQKIQRTLEKRITSSLDYIEKANLLTLLRRLPADLAEKPSDQQILTFAVNTTLTNSYEITTSSLFFVSSSIIHCASALVSYMGNPADLERHMNYLGPESMHLIQTIITTEEQLRENNIAPDVFLGEVHKKDYFSHTIDGGPSPYERIYNNLLDSLRPAVEHIQKWQSTLFTNPIREKVPRQLSSPEHRFQDYSAPATLYNLHHYLSQDVGKSVCIALLEKGFSQDMVARIALHDMAHPEHLALSKRILEQLSGNTPDTPTTPSLAAHTANYSTAGNVN